MKKKASCAKVLISEPCLSGLRYLFAKEAGALKPLDGSNPSGSAWNSTTNWKLNSA